MNYSWQGKLVLIQYMIFYVSAGMLAALLLKAFSIFTFRTKGKVMGYEFEVGSAEYKQYKGRADTRALALTLSSIIGLAILTAWQTLAIVHKHASNSTITMILGATVSVFFVLWAFYSVIKASEKIRSIGHTDDKHSRTAPKDSWKLP